MSASDSAADLAGLEKRIGYVFRDRALLRQAVTTPACRMDHPEMPDNQRLEFLGDAVFGLLAADALFKAYPGEPEGALTVRRTHLVSGAVLADVAEQLGLRAYLRQNRGARELPPRAKPLSDALEAVMGAVWADGGLAAVETVFRRLALPVKGALDEWRVNPKGYLQVKAQALKPSRKPVYTVNAVTGPDHAPVVTVTVEVQGLGKATVTAASKTAAEVAAAAKLLETLDGGAGAPA